MNIFYIVAFLVGTGFGWCLCSLVDIFRKYLETKRNQRKSEEKWTNLRQYLEHCMTNNTEGGLVWISYDELRERERRMKQNGLYDKQTRSDSEETSGNA